MTEHPEITFRDGPTGPRAALVGGPDVWEVIQTIDGHPGDRKAAVPATAELLNLTERQVQAAIDYQATDSKEIDARIKLKAHAAQRAGSVSTRRGDNTLDTFKHEKLY